VGVGETIRVDDEADAEHAIVLRCGPSTSSSLPSIAIRRSFSIDRRRHGACSPRIGGVVMSSATPLDNDASESRILIDACLARLREEAGLDAEPVLPPLHLFLGKPAAAPMRPLLHPPRSPGLGLAPLARPAPPRTPPTSASARSEHPTSIAKLSRSYMRWPLVLCAFIGGVFGGVALMKSPVGQKPAVQHVAKLAQKQLLMYGAMVAAKATKL
jgi:hypothetical protein